MILDQQDPHSLVNSASQLADLSGRTGVERRRIVLGVVIGYPIIQTTQQTYHEHRQ